ncbi:MAG: hypothetical protein Q8L22_14050, partial [Reyranella sp.]|nr:hypothetical protein [Reyranella sp.]
RWSPHAGQHRRNSTRGRAPRLRMDSLPQVVLTFQQQSYSGARDRVMDKPVIDTQMVEMLARRAGLDKALAEFPDDVAAAVSQAAGTAQKFKAPADPRAEPWPPMRAGDGL